MNDEMLNNWTRSYLDYKLQTYTRRNLDNDRAFNALPSDRFSRWITKSSETFYREENSKLDRLNERLKDTHFAACNQLGEQTVSLLEDLFPEDADHRCILDAFLDASREMGALALLAPQINNLYTQANRELLPRLNSVKNDRHDIFSADTFFNHTMAHIRTGLVSYCGKLIDCGHDLEGIGRADLAQTIMIEPAGFNSLPHLQSDLQNRTTATPLSVAETKIWLRTLSIKTFDLADIANTAAHEIKETKKELINEINIEPLPDQVRADLADAIETLPSLFIKRPACQTMKGYKPTLTPASKA